MEPARSKETQITARVGQLGYFVIGADNPAAWEELALAIGFDVSRRDDGLDLRVDADRKWRIAVERGEHDGAVIAGWEAPDADSFRVIADRLKAAGQPVASDPALAIRRGVRDVVAFADPDGNRAELYWGAATFLRTRFQSPHGVVFRAGAEGVGHLTIAVPDFRRTLDFYRDILGLVLTEIADVGVLQVGFLRANSRHHSLAFAQMGNSASAVVHLMVEVSTLDELGSIRDRIIASDQRLARDIGRHPTDDVISIYIATPAAFELEVGWGSIVVDEATWVQDRYRRSGWSWGHRAAGKQGDAAGLGH